MWAGNRTDQRTCWCMLPLQPHMQTLPHAQSAAASTQVHRCKPGAFLLEILLKAELLEFTLRWFNLVWYSNLIIIPVNADSVLCWMLTTAWWLHSGSEPFPTFCHAFTHFILFFLRDDFAFPHSNTHTGSHTHTSQNAPNFFVFSV